VFRKRSQYSKKLKAMRDAKERKRLESDAPDYPPILPELRRRIIIIDYDFGKPVVHKMELMQSNRIDQYKVMIDGKFWKQAGWSKALEGIRKSFFRVRYNS